MQLTPDEAKKAIREFIKQTPELKTNLWTFSLQRPLGEGGNALVYEASYGKGELMAVKFLAEDCSEGKTKRFQRFLAEFREIMRLSNTGAVSNMYELDFILTPRGKYPFIVMEKYPFTLKTWLDKNPVKSLEQLLPILEDLMECLSVIHAKNIVHRDLKPENIFLTKSNKVILADFGIAWFDPEHYERLVQTTKGERLANHTFSAPEQFQKNPIPHITMDLFALGQLIQWIITGDTHRGTGRQQLSSIDPSFASLDSLVDALLQQDPNNRPQNIDSVKQILSNRLKPKIQELDPSIGKSLYKFDRLLASSCPGKRGIIAIEDKIKIDTFMNKLAQETSIYQIWWTVGRETMQIRKIRKFDNDIWLLDDVECNIKSVWINRDDRSYRNFIILQCDTLPTYEPNASTRDWDEAAWFRDRYIHRGEYDDGYAEIDGEIVETNGEAELRTRWILGKFLFIGTHGSSVTGIFNKKIVRQVCESLLENKNVTAELLQPLRSLLPTHKGGVSSLFKTLQDSNISEV